MLNYFSVPAIRDSNIDSLMNSIAIAVSSVQEISIDEILSKSRRSKLIESRRFVIGITHKFGKINLNQIARYFGDTITNHSTVIYHAKKLNDYIETDITTRIKYVKILECLSRLMEHDDLLVKRIDRSIKNIKS